MARWQPVVASASTCAWLLFATPDASFAAQRTFVSGHGNDANPCSVSAPCRSFAAALAHTDHGGEVIVLDSAGYGPVTITNSVSIIAPRGIYAGIAVPPGQTGISISPGSAEVLLRGLTINGQGGDDGVLVASAVIVQIEECVISNNGNDAGDAGIRVTSPNARVYVRDSILRGNAGPGVRVQEDGVSLVLVRTRVERNGVGVSAGGATLDVAIRDSVIAENGGSGIALSSASAAEALKVGVSATAISRNGGDGISASAASAGAINLTLSGNAIADNAGTGVDVTAATPQTIILTRNAITHNAKGLAAGVLSDATNVVDSNANADTGSVGAAVVR